MKETAIRTFPRTALDFDSPKMSVFEFGCNNFQCIQKSLFPHPQGLKKSRFASVRLLNGKIVIPPPHYRNSCPPGSGKGPHRKVRLQIRPPVDGQICNVLSGLAENGDNFFKRIGIC